MNLMDILDQLELEMSERKTNRGAIVAGIAFLDRQIEKLKCMFYGRRIMHEMDICRLISALKYERRSLKHKLKKL